MARRAKDSRSFEVLSDGPLWSPEVALRGQKRLGREPRAEDHYAVIDDLDEDVAVLERSRWPRLDGAGRPFFEVLGSQRCSRAALTRAVRGCRRSLGQPASSRKLRIGDAFWIRGSNRLGDDPDEWDMVDVTEPARRLAKVAHYGLVAAVSEKRASRLEVAERKKPGSSGAHPPGNSSAVARPEV